MRDNKIRKSTIFWYVIGLNNIVMELVYIHKIGRI